MRSNDQPTYAPRPRVALAAPVAILLITLLGSSALAMDPGPEIESGTPATRLAQVEAQLVELQARLAEVTATNDLLSEQVHALTTERSGLVEDLASLKEENTTLAEQVRTLTGERDALADESSALGEALAALEAEMAGLQAENATLVAENGALERDRSRLEAAAAHLDDLFAPLEADRQLLVALRKEMPTDSRTEAEAHVERIARLAAAANPSALGQLADRLSEAAPAYLEWRFTEHASPEAATQAYVTSGANAFDTTMSALRSASLLSVANRLDGLLNVLDRIS